jgi:hypothetical protein
MDYKSRSPSPSRASSPSFLPRSPVRSPRRPVLRPSRDDISSKNFMFDNILKLWYQIDKYAQGRHRIGFTGLLNKNQFQKFNSVVESLLKSIEKLENFVEKKNITLIQDEIDTLDEIKDVLIPTTM